MLPLSFYAVDPDGVRSPCKNPPHKPEQKDRNGSVLWGMSCDLASTYAKGVSGSGRTSAHAKEVPGNGQISAYAKGTSAHFLSS